MSDTELKALADDLQLYGEVMRQAKERLQLLEEENALLKARLKIADAKLAKIAKERECPTI